MKSTTKTTSITTSENKTQFKGIFSIPNEVSEQCEFCYGSAIKLADFNSFQVNLCRKCINLVEFILHIVNDNHQKRR